MILDHQLMDRFLDTVYHIVPGQHCTLAEFVADFHEYQTKRGIDPWDETRIVSNLPVAAPCGRGNRNVRCIGNLTRYYERPPSWVKVGNNIRLEPPKSK